VHSAHNGIVHISVVSQNNELCLSFSFDFTKGKAHADLSNSSFLSLNSGGTANCAIALLKYKKAVIGNGIIEIKFPNNEKVKCEIVIPVNIDIRRTFEAINQDISELEESQSKE